MTSIALFGAGGKMGHRLSRNFIGSRFDIRHVEVSETGRERLSRDFGISCRTPETAIEGAEVVIWLCRTLPLARLRQALSIS